MSPVARSFVAVAARPQLTAACRLRTAAIAAPFSATTSPSSQPSLQQLQPPQHYRQRHPLLVPSLLQHFSAACRASSPLRRRCYHSLDHPAEPPPQDCFSAEEQAILAAAYRHIPEHGFSDRALALGARDAGYPSISTAILPDGVFSLVRWHLVSQRVALAARCRDIFHDDAAAATPADSQPVPLSPAGISARAQRITWERLLGNKAVVGRWQEALAIMAQPSFVPASLRELALLVDEIWALASDTSVDPSWYTKRASLSAIYASSELFMTTDTDPDFAATRDFLHRRFHDVQQVGGYIGAVGQWAGFAASAGVNVLRSKGVPI